MKKTILLILVGLVGCDQISQNGQSEKTIKADASSLLKEMANDKPTDFLLVDAKIHNSESAYIPPQCYTKVTATDHGASNPCYSCHVDGKQPNYLHDDSNLQTDYDFTEYSSNNRYKNLFLDRTDSVNLISDVDMDNYVNQGNYFDLSGNIQLAKKLNDIPKSWDANSDGKWNGFIPDIYFNIDSEGFDLGPSGKETGWVAFAYYPFLGAFMPTNGSTDDVFIRLPEAFKNNEEGQFDRHIYKVNLAIVESLIRERNIQIETVDEKLIKVDLNRNGLLDQASQVVYQWAPLKGQSMRYVGQAKMQIAEGEVVAGLYPKGTEFLHSVRYLSVENDHVKMSARMKELRYSKKVSWNNYAQLSRSVSSEIKERNDFQNRLSQYNSPRKSGIEAGLNNGRGWRYQGFIEDKEGGLRPQSYEETLFCMGCHTGIGSTTDASFAFPRKFDFNEFQHGYYHWSQKGIEGTKDPVRHDGNKEYAYYLENNPTGDEFSSNNEVKEKFFDTKGRKTVAFDRLDADISTLLMPSPARARILNKAYKVIVDEQSYIYGRDPHVEPLTNIHKKIPIGEETGVLQSVEGSIL